MTIQDRGAIGELIGALAVLITLVYLSVQTKLSLKAQKAQTVQQTAHERAKNLRMFVENRELRDAAAKSTAGESLNEEEQQLLNLFTTISVRSFENELYQHSMGMIGDDELEIRRKLLELPHINIELAHSNKHLFTPKTQVELDKLLSARRDA